MASDELDPTLNNIDFEVEMNFRVKEGLQRVYAQALERGLTEEEARTFTEEVGRVALKQVTERIMEQPE